MNPLEDDDLEPPGKPDFRRVGKGTPFVLNPNGKRVRYGRPSNVGKILDDESNLVDWKLRTTVVGAAQRPDLMAVVSTLDPAADKKKLRDIAEECLVSGKGMERTVKGTAVHSMFDHLDANDGWEPAPQWKPLCDSYLAALERWGLEVQGMEIHCINDEYHLAGSMDRRYRTTKVLVAPDSSTIPIGSCLAADTKTGSTLEYATGTYATQLAAYASSVQYNVETDEREPFNPPTHEEWGLIVHADSASDQVQIYWVDLNAGREGLKLAQQVKGWRTRSDLLTLGAGPVALVPASSPPDPPEVAQDAGTLASLHQWTRERVRAAVGHSELAAKAMQQYWPAGVPGLKNDGHTREQLEAIVEAVERVEFQFSLPFFPSWVDPEAKARHPSARWAKPDTGERVPQDELAAIRELIDQHPRKELIRSWVKEIPHRAGGLNFPLAHALYEFANLDDSDEALTMLLWGTLRAMGTTIKTVKPEEAPLIMSAAFSIAAGTAMLLYDENDVPVLRTNIVKG